MDCHPSNGQLLLLPGGNESTSPSPLILLFQLSHPPGLEHGTISGRPSSWVMCSNSGPKPLSLHPQNTLLSSPLGPVSAYVSELWARAQALSSFPVQELPKARPASVLAETLASMMSSICIPSRAISYCRDGSRAFFFNPIKPHADCDTCSTI